MRWAIPCLTCGACISSHFQIFLHEPVCTVQVISDLRAREATAQREAWRLTKENTRLEKHVHRLAQRIGAGRAGVLTVGRFLQQVKQVTGPHEPMTSV